MDFIAIDVETANADMASICQIGLAVYRDGLLADEWTSYVDPQDYFDRMNTSVHGITETDVAGAPSFRELADQVHIRFRSAVVVSHTHFDRVAIHQAARRHSVELPPARWLDSARVARRAWQQCARSGYGLKDVCAMLGYDFRHHDALEDAKAAAHIILAACQEHALDIEGWLSRVEQPIDPTASSSGSAIRRTGDPDGPLHGEVVVFTGALRMPRTEAADLASALGCEVATGPTKKTTVLVVGDQDVSRLAGHDKSSKHRKAEALIEKGVPIRILKESDFYELTKVITAA